MTRRYKKRKTKKHTRRTKKYNKTKKYKGGSNFRAKWVGIPNPKQPTGFNWLDNNKFKPCNN